MEDRPTSGESNDVNMSLGRTLTATLKLYSDVLHHLHPNRTMCSPKLKRCYHRRDSSGA